MRNLSSTESPMNNNTRDYTLDTIICITIGSLGVMDNGFVILIMLKNNAMKKRICNIFIVHQSVVDLVASLFLLCNSPLLPTFGSVRGVSADFFCRVWDSNYIFWAAITASTYNLVAITIERYLEVVYPLRYKSLFTLKRAKLFLLGVWIIGFAVPIVTSVVASPPTTDWTSCVRKHSGWSSPVLSWLVAFYALFMGFLIPVIIMLVCYIHMIMTFSPKVKPCGPNVIPTESERRRCERLLKVRKSLVRTMIVVSIVFVICWIGDQIYFFLFNIGQIELEPSFTTFFVSLAFINCCINPLIYTCQYSDFQLAISAFFKSKSHKEDHHERSVLDRSSQKI